MVAWNKKKNIVIQLQWFARLPNPHLGCLLCRNGRIRSHTCAGREDSRAEPSRGALCSLNKLLKMTRTPWCVSAQLGRSCQEDEFVAWWRAFINVTQRCSALFKDDTERGADSSSWWFALTEPRGFFFVFFFFCYAFLNSLEKFDADKATLMEFVFPLNLERNV